MVVIGREWCRPSVAPVVTGSGGRSRLTVKVEHDELAGAATALEGIHGKRNTTDQTDDASNTRFGKYVSRQNSERMLHAPPRCLRNIVPCTIPT